MCARTLTDQWVSFLLISFQFWICIIYSISEQDEDKGLSALIVFCTHTHTHTLVLSRGKEIDTLDE